MMKHFYGSTRSILLYPMMSSHSQPKTSSHGDASISEPLVETKTPSFYRVLLLNDDFTPIDFVVHVLQKFFHKNLQEAQKITLDVHEKGSGVCGVYSFEIAETKVYLVNQYARQNRHPLKCTMEREGAC